MRERGPLAESPSSLSLSSGRARATGCRAASAYRGRATPCCQSTATVWGPGRVRSRTDGVAARLRERPQVPAEATWTLRFVFDDDSDGDGDGDGDGDKGYLKRGGGVIEAAATQEQKRRTGDREDKRVPKHYRPRRRGRSARGGGGRGGGGVRLGEAPSFCISKSMFLFYRPSTQENLFIARKKSSEADMRISARRHSRYSAIHTDNSIRVWGGEMSYHHCSSISTAPHTPRRFLRSSFFLISFIFFPFFDVFLPFFSCFSLSFIFPPRA